MTSLTNSDFKANTFWTMDGKMTREQGLTRADIEQARVGLKLALGPLGHDGVDQLCALALRALAPEAGQPVAMLMFCPRCSQQHVDAPKGEWTNPPHATHTCQHCGLLWRPSNANTIGVSAITQLEDKHAERIAAAFPPTPSAAGQEVRNEALEEKVKALARMVVNATPFPIGSASLQEYEAVPVADVLRLLWLSPEPSAGSAELKGDKHE